MTDSIQNNAEDLSQVLMSRTSYAEKRSKIQRKILKSQEYLQCRQENDGWTDARKSCDYNQNTGSSVFMQTDDAGTNGRARAVSGTYKVMPPSHDSQLLDRSDPYLTQQGRPAFYRGPQSFERNKYLRRQKLQSLSIRRAAPKTGGTSQEASAALPLPTRNDALDLS